MKRFAVATVVGVSVLVAVAAGGCSSSSNSSSQPDASSGGVVYTVPSNGGQVTVHATSELVVGFAFPASAAGATLTLTPVDPASAGWSTSDFATVIKMEPEGTQFTDPIVVTGPSVLMATFPAAAGPTAPTWLPLAPDGSGALLYRSAALGVVPQSCGAFGYAKDDTSCAQTYSGNGVSYTMTCALPHLCSAVTVRCCDGQGLLADCAFGSVDVAVTATPLASPGDAYCPVVDGGPAYDAGASLDASSADATSTETSDAAADAALDAATTDAPSSEAPDGALDAATVDDAATPDAGTGEVLDAAPDAPSPDSGVNGNCSTATFAAGDAGTGTCTVQRIDGAATLLMKCTPTSCQCYADDTSHPYGASFGTGSSYCPQQSVALQLMISSCGCPAQ